MAKERYQNPAISDDLKLRFLTYNSNNLADVDEIQEVEIYFLDPSEVSETNTDGRRLVESVDGTSVTQEDTGHYSATITLESDTYTIGRYLDVWKFTVPGDDEIISVEQRFRIHPALWYTSDVPIIYDFSFRLMPNKIRMGSKRYLIIDITPNVPTGNDLERYYQNLAIASPVRISIEQACVECMPAEEDLRLLVDCDLVEHREKCRAFYYLDTSDYAVGIYNVWFQMEFGGNTYISDKQQLQIF